MISLNFSVLISVYKNDDPVFFTKALDSIELNTLLPAELVIVVDGPITIALELVLESFKSKSKISSIIIHKLAHNSGLASALNEGIKIVTNDLVFRVDADDINEPDRFSTCLEFMTNNPKIGILGGDILEVSKSGSVLSKRIVPKSMPDIIATLPLRNPFNHMTVVFRASLVRCVGGYPLVHLKEDYALWCKLLANGVEGANLDKILVRATTDIDFYSRRGGLKYALAEFELQSLMVKLGIKSVIKGIVHGICRSTIFIAPRFVRKFVYIKLLRTN